MANKPKYYVVWKGRKTGIFSSWQECKASVEGFADAKYKSFDTLPEAKYAFSLDYSKFIWRKPTQPKPTSTGSPNLLLHNQLPIHDALCVDAACSGKTGVMEYRGVYILTGKQLFHYQHPHGTNNIGEFLAIVHGLSYLKRHNYSQPLYSDSVNAIKWVRDKHCKTLLPLTPETQDLFDYIHRAENWLRLNTYSTQILKWQTDIWGEIPADFGRK
jgi:ribonuclease HI